MKYMKSIKYQIEQVYDRLRYNHAVKDFHIHVLSTEETLLEIIKDRKSLCRFGDGELYLIFGGGRIDLPFQQYDEDLSKDLLNIISIPKKNNLLIGLPNIFNGVGEYTDNAAKFWKTFVGHYQNNLKEIVDSNVVYANTNCTRFYSGYKDKTKCKSIIALFRKIWTGRDVVIIEGEKTRMGVGNNFFDDVHSLRRILLPAMNAYSCKDQIVTYVKSNSFHKDTLFLLAAGPTATVLSYELNEMGYQALDVGHVDIQYEYYLRNADGKVKIEGKYVNEAKDGKDVTDEICDETYYSSIVACFK